LHQRRVLTARERQGDGLLRGHDGTALARILLEAQARGLYFDRFREPADAERDVDALAIADGQGDVLHHGRGEALELGLDLVAAHAQGEELVRAAVVGGGDLRDVGVDVAQRDGHAWQHAATPVLHGAGDRTGFELGVRRPRPTQQQGTTHEESLDGHVNLLRRTD